MEIAGRYELEGRGSDLCIRVRGPDIPACLSAAVEGFAAAVGDPEAHAPRDRAAIDLEGDPVELLVALLDEAILRLDADGELAVALRGARIAQRRLRAQLETVALAAVHVRGAPPKAATWHGARLERARETGEGWSGEVMLDL